MNMTFVIVQAILSYALLASMFALRTKKEELKFVHYFFGLNYRDA